MGNYLILLSGIYLICGALIIKTENIPSAFAFKIIPFFFGSAQALLMLKALGYI